MHYDVIIIGGGLFGQIVRKALEHQGRTVLCIDAKKGNSGSRPAACLMKPSWFSSMGKDVYEPALTLLDELYGITDIQFSLQPTKAVGKVGRATVHWINPNRVLSPSTYHGEVVSILDRTVTLRDGHTMTADLIVVAAGIWTQKLLPQYEQVGQQGIAWLYKGVHCDEPTIQPWAPYRQLVRFDRYDGTWVSDGTAIKATNWMPKHAQASYKRCTKFAGICDQKPTPMMGIRPYAKGHKPCLIEEVRPGLWVASGGAKNGTLGAGYCAHRIMTETS